MLLRQAQQPLPPQLEAYHQNRENQLLRLNGNVILGGKHEQRHLYQQKQQIYHQKDKNSESQ
jgi:hypothetical protein